MGYTYVKLYVPKTFCYRTLLLLYNLSLGCVVEMLFLCANVNEMLACCTEQFLTITLWHIIFYTSSVGMVYTTDLWKHSTISICRGEAEIKSCSCSFVNIRADDSIELNWKSKVKRLTMVWCKRFISVVSCLQFIYTTKQYKARILYGRRVSM
jgi:hypothetical protein